MKKALSVLFVLALIMGILGSFPISFAAEDNTPYSGGSGTEDDPYLISNIKDIKELYDNIISSPKLWSTKYYYKLINDITTDHAISPLYDSYRNGKNCFVKTEYSREYIFDLRSTYTDEQLKEWYSPIIDEMGYLYARNNTFFHKGYQMYLSESYTKYTKFTAYPKVDFPDYDIPDYSYYYRMAAFTGIFDGNGYTINCNGYLFGFLENGAEVKNLKIGGECASLAFSISDSSSVKNCTINSELSFADYCSVGVNIPESAMMFDDYVVYGGAIAQNYGIVENCVNNSDGITGLIGFNYGNAVNCANYGKTSVKSSEHYDKTVNSLLEGDYYMNDEESGKSFPSSMTYYEKEEALKANYVQFPSRKGIEGGKSCIDYANDEKAINGDGYFAINECQTANGDISIYKAEGFDFENAWIMISGYPILRSACRANAGDLNIDGIVNSVDTNLMKRYLCESPEALIYTFLGSADINLDGSINAADSALLRRMLVG